MSYLQRFVNRAWAHATSLWHRCIANLAYWAAAGDTGSCVVESLDGEPAIGGRVCVFVHFDGQGVLRSHTRRYLVALGEHGISVVLVSNAGRLQTESLAFARRYCARVVLRANRGYDFGAYRDGILSLGIEPGKFISLIIANDSVFGPIMPLAPLFDRMDFAAADVWAATDSWQHRYHLQSYLIAFGPAAMNHVAFREFWASVRNVRSKWATVRYCEIGLTQRLQAAGLRCSAIWDYQSLMQSAWHLVESDVLDPRTQPLAMEVRRSADHAVRAAATRVALNPTSELWLLLLWLGYPFIKRELLRRNPSKVSNLVIWHRIVRSRAPDLYREIVDDLKHVARNILP